MQLLVTGVGGLLGSNLVSLAAAAGHDIFGTYHTVEPDLPVPCRQLDVTDHATFRDLIDGIHPDVVVNCAAMTDVDACESDPDRADEVNGGAPGEMATICIERDIEFVQTSTDYVFDGTRKTKYTEGTDPDPIQVYGQSKLRGERRVRESHSSPLIVRLSFVYGVHAATDELEGFPNWVISRLANNEDVPLFVDQHVTPSRAGQAASTILSLVDEAATGTYHVACSDCITPYEFGEAICGIIDEDLSLLSESTTADFSRAAARPAHTCLDVKRVEERLNRPQPGLVTDLRAIRPALEGNAE